MKLYLILALVLVVLLVWLRSGIVHRRVRRGILVEFLIFILAVVSLIGLVFLAGRLF